MSLAAKLPYSHPYANGFGYGGTNVPTDTDGLDYLSRMATADGAGLETGIAGAIDRFIKACKADNIWDSIRASCILAGARTLAGALVPIKNEGPELWDMGNVPTPTILDGDGSAGAWDAATLTFSNENSSGNATRPRFTFPVSTTGGKSYYISGRFSGDYTAVSRVSLGTIDGATTFVDGVFSGTAIDASGNLTIFLNGTLGPSAITIESLSIREVIAAPTNVADGFVEGDYSRTDGLTGDGTSYIDSGRAASDDPLNDAHIAVFLTAGKSAPAVAVRYAGITDTTSPATSFMLYDDAILTGGYINSSIITDVANKTAINMVGATRGSSSEQTAYVDGSSVTSANSSIRASDLNSYVFCRNLDGSANLFADATIAFYSIGTSLSLEDLDTAVTNLMADITFFSNTGLNPADYDTETVRYVNAGYAAGGTLE